MQPMPKFSPGLSEVYASHVRKAAVNRTEDLSVPKFLRDLRASAFVNDLQPTLGQTLRQCDPAFVFRYLRVVGTVKFPYRSAREISRRNGDAVTESDKESSNWASHAQFRGGLIRATILLGQENGSEHVSADPGAPSPA
jgi:hypothetical protein